MAGFGGMRNLDVWYARLDVDRSDRARSVAVSPWRVDPHRANLEQARTKDSLKAFSKLTRIVNGEPRINERPAADRAGSRSSPPRAMGAGLSEAIQALIRSYRRSLPNDRRKLLERFR